MKRHDLINKKTMTTKTNTMTMTMTFREHPQRAIFNRYLWPEAWHLRHWLHFWQLRTTILTFTLWPLNRKWRGQHPQFLRCLLLWRQNFLNMASTRNIRHSGIYQDFHFYPNFGTWYLKTTQSFVLCPQEKIWLKTLKIFQKERSIEASVLTPQTVRENTSIWFLNSLNSSLNS